MAKGEVLWHTKAEGWVILYEEDPIDQAIINLLQHTNDVPWGISGIAGLPIVPEWVKDAMKVYNDAGGYAGLSPAEYLDKVSNGRPVQPKHTF